MLDPQAQQRLLTSPEPSAQLPPSEETIRKNEMARIRSRQLADQVIQDLNLNKDPEFNSALAAPSMSNLSLGWIAQVLGKARGANASSGERTERDQMIDAFLRRLQVLSTDASRVIDIRFTSIDPENAARIAHAVAVGAIEQKIVLFNAQAVAATKALEADIRALNARLRDAEQKVETIRREQGSLPASEIQVLSENIYNLTVQIASATAERAAAEGRLTELEAARAAGRVETLPSVLASPVVQRLQAEAAQLSARIVGQATVYDSSTPRLTELRAVLRGLNAQMEREIARIAASFQSEAAAARSKEASLLGRQDALKQQLAKARVSEVDVRMHQREADISRTLLDKLVLRLNNTQSEADRFAPAGRIISDATVSRSPSFPPVVPMVAMGFVLFATGGGLASILLEKRNDSIRSAARLREISGIRVLGAIPDTGSGLLRKKLPPPARIIAEPRSMFADSLRAVWFQLEHAVQDPPKAILVTSAVSGEGKSATAVSMARMLAQSGHRVAIVDADLRAPKVHGILGLHQGPGLADLVDGTADLTQVLQHDRQSGAAVITSGTVDRSPLEILRAPAMQRLLRDLSLRFTFVIIDSPPVLAVPDSGVLARLVDTTVLVVRWASTRCATFTTAHRQLQDLDINVQGVMLTMVDPKQYAQYGYLTGDILPGTSRTYYAG